MKHSQLPEKWKNLFLLMVFNLVIIAFSFAQVHITGKVYSKNGITDQSFSVTVKGTTYGTNTDKTGSYKLAAQLKAGKYNLVFSSVGYQTATVQLIVGSNTEYVVDAEVTEEISKLDEVVVTGASAGTTRKQLGSYVSTVKENELKNGATSNVLSALQGKTAGAQITQNSGDPAGGISVKLRGISTINGSTEPLYIIDGIIVDNSTTGVTNTQAGYSTAGSIGQNRMVDINPNDIERIEVLNGAAAAAIYGSRANAGVIQIFTKKGSTGAPQISFSSSVNFNELRKKLDVNMAGTKWGGDPMLNTQNNTAAPTGISLTQTAVNRYDYQDYIFRQGIGTENNVAVSGGKEKTKYYTSASYLSNQGIIKNTDFNRFSFRLNLEQELAKWATFNVNMNYINSNTNEKPDGNSFYSPTNGVTIIGNYYNIQQRDALGNLQAVGEKGRVNPVSIIEDIKQKQQTNRIITGAGLKITPIHNLSLDFHTGIDNYSQGGTTYIPPYAYAVSTAFYGAGAPGTTANQTLNGYSSAATNNYFQINHDINATYNWKINHNLSSVTQVGYSLQYQKSNFVLIQGQGLAPFIQAVNGASTILPSADIRTEQSIWGQFLQQNFKYRNQFFLTGAIRFDGSSVFGPTERNQVYRKLSGSYVISGTDYWSRLGISKWINLLKLRAAYGESGNLSGITPYSRFNNYASNPYLGVGIFQTSTQLANTGVKPERQNEVEIGTDMAFANNRINFTFNYYQKKVNDLLISRAIAPTNGFTNLLDNIGSLQNEGYEVVLNAVPIKSKKFSWDMTLIYNHNQNKALNIGQSIILISTDNGGAPVGILQNQPIGVFYGTFFARNTDGSLLKDANGWVYTEKGTQTTPTSFTTSRDPLSGLPSGTALQKVIGNPNPKYTATLTNDFNYKKFSLHIQLDAVQGVDVFNADFRTRQGVDNGTVAQQEDLGQIPHGFIASAYQVAEWRVDNGSFVKLRELSVSFDLGKTKYTNDLSVNIGGRNLISWDHYKGYDPEVNATGQSTIMRGIDFGSTPAPRVITVGIRAKF